MLAFLLGSATALGSSSVYHCFLKRIKNAEWVTQRFMPNLLGQTSDHRHHDQVRPYPLSELGMHERGAFTELRECQVDHNDGAGKPAGLPGQRRETVATASPSVSQRPYSLFA